MPTVTSIKIISNAAQLACAGAVLLLLASCSEMPVLRSQADSDITVPFDSSESTAAKCQTLRDQIRANQESGREAPTISTSPQIVAAAEGKADQRVDELQRRLEALDCPDAGNANSTGSARVAPMPPAPNAPNP